MLPATFRSLTLPVLCSPMFIVSSPELVIAQCRAGIVGTLPSLNFREPEQFEPALIAIAGALARMPNSAPFGVNLIVHPSNVRLDHDLEVCIRQKVPLIITSLGSSAAIVDRIHSYGGMVFHDVISAHHAAKAAAAKVDGIIGVSAGAGGHSGTISPFALCAEIRQLFDGIIVMAGAISRGGDVAAARAAGADLAYMGTRFIATQEAAAVSAYKKMILDSAASDILYTPFFSGVPGNYLRPSIAAAGLDPEGLAHRDKNTLMIGVDGAKAKVWKDIWSAGHGVGAIHDLPTVDELVATMQAEYAAALAHVAWPPDA